MDDYTKKLLQGYGEDCEVVVCGELFRGKTFKKKTLDANEVIPE